MKIALAACIVFYTGINSSWSKPLNIKELKQFFCGFSSAILFCFLMFKGLLQLEFIPV